MRQEPYFDPDLELFLRQVQILYLVKLIKVVLAHHRHHPQILRLARLVKYQAKVPRSRRLVQNHKVIKRIRYLVKKLYQFLAAKNQKHVH